MSNETLHPKEFPPITPPRNGGGTDNLSKQRIQSLAVQRKQCLEGIKPDISRKLYFMLEEKLEKEQKNLEEILDWQQGKLSRLSRYSLILDSHYFEQEFLS